MTTVRKRKHNRSSRSKQTRHLKRKHRNVLVADEVIAKAWDHKKTASQNYQKIGLARHLQPVAGGIEKGAEKVEPLSLTSSLLNTKKPAVQAAKIIRNEDGSVKIEYHNTQEDGNDSDSELPPVEASTEYVKELERRAAMVETKPRTQSAREKDWIERMIEKHGDDIEAMFWDKELNIWQQSRGDIRRRVNKWKKSHK